MKWHLRRAVILMIILCTTVSARGQMNVTNSTIVVSPGTKFTWSGDIELNTGGQFDNQGEISIGGDWTNNSGGPGLVNGGRGPVILTGDSQSIDGTDTTVFYNLKLEGTGAKILGQHTVVTNELNLGNRELALDAFKLIVTNGDSSAIVRNNGFVSNTLQGRLVRAVNSTRLYWFPMGNTQPSYRYRPVVVDPKSVGTAEYEVALIHNNPTTDGYDITLTDTVLCQVNNLFYHRVHQTTGSIGASVRFYFDDQADGSFTNIGLWNTVPTRWEDVGGILNSQTSPILSYLDASYTSQLGMSPVALANEGVRPQITASAGNTTFCDGDSVILEAPTGYTSYVWASGSTTRFDTVKVSGNYNVTVTDVNGCVTTSTNAVIVNAIPAPTPTIAANNALSFCDGDSVTLDGGSGFSTYQWSNSVQSQQNTIKTSQTVGLTVTDLNGCVGSATPVNVTVNSNPLPTIGNSGATTFCDGDSVILDGGSGFSTYEWSNNIQNQQNTVKTSQTVGLTVTDVNGCEGIATPVTVVVNSNPQPVITNSSPSSFCDGDSVGLTTLLSFSNYNWSSGGANSQTFVKVSGWEYVTVTDVNGCQGFDSININFNSNPIVQLPDPQFCAGGTFQLDAGNPGATYLWSTGDPAQTISISQAGTYSVTVTDANGCKGIDTSIATTYSTPPVFAGNDSAICAGAAVTLTATGGSTYVWNTGATTAQTMVNPVNSGYYSVEGTDANGCSGIDSVFITVNSNPNGTITADTAVCAGGSVDLTASGGTTYLWSTNAQTTTITVSPTSITSYTVTVTDANNCSDTLTTQVDVNALPQVSLSATDTIICDNSAPVVLTGTPTGGILAGLGVANGAFDPAQVDTGTYAIYYTYTDLDGCAANDSTVIKVEKCSGVNTVLNRGVINVYPNPTDGIVNIQFSDLSVSPEQIQVRDALGRIVKSKSVSGLAVSGSQQLNMSDLSSGTYWLLVETETDYLVKKIMLIH